MIRVPQFPYHAKLEDVWDELLQSIEFASVEFHQKIAHLTPQTLLQQPPKIINTVIKYFNRAKYRCTPLGTFSSFGIINIHELKDSHVPIKDIRILHQFPKWKNINQIEYLFSDVLDRNLKLFANSTYYQLGNTIRYVRRKEDLESFELAEVEKDADVMMVLAALRSPLSINELIEKLNEKIETEQLLGLTEAMILSNLLFTEFDPNTIGIDYFTRIGKYNYNNTTPYIISELNTSDCKLSSQYFRHLPALIDLLTKILPGQTNAIHLTEFISQYTQRFDRKHIRIMEALDPQIGVGYGNFYSEERNDSLINKLLSNMGQQKAPNDDEQLKDFLKKRLNFNSGDVIDLSSLEIEVFKTETENKLPNTFSVIGSLVDDCLHLERIGGSTANQLAGRFSLCGDQAQQYAKDIAALEESANPEVVFFDIAYHAELNVDNINRRSQLYSQELNLISYSCIDAPLTLDDLYISISGNAIVLRSQLLGKRVMPRMSSAYNYRRSKLPVFRFLYDLAFYGVWPELTFDISQILPQLNYYPKVVFKNIVLSMPRLNLYRKNYKGQTEDEITTQIKQLMENHGFGNLIKILKGEEHTIYDLREKTEFQLFISEITQHEKTTMEDFPIPENSVANDKNNSPFVNQVIVPMYHKREIYHESASQIHDTVTRERDFLPLQEWLYFDIFLHPLNADELLLNPIQRLLHTFSQHIEKWFFIRYNEHGEHIRLRINGTQSYLAPMASHLSQLLKPYYDSGLIKDFKISTYQRELERYDVVGISEVETHFHKSSLLTLSLLLSNATDIEKYEHCLRIMLAIQKSKVIGDKRFLEWTDFIRRTLEKEHRLEANSFKEMNRFIKDNLKYPYGDPAVEEDIIIHSIINLLERCPERRKAPLLTDLIHMHVNRLFAEHQRTHEMVFYNILCTAYRKNKHQVNTTYHADESAV